MTTLNVLNCPGCGSPLGEHYTPYQQFQCPACGSMLVLTDWTDEGQVICEKCGTVNSSESKFCTRCATILQSGCPFCYTLNDLDATHCRRCGANLQNAWDRQRSWLTEKQQHDAERRVALQQAMEEGKKAEISRLLLQLEEPENHPMAVFCLQQHGAEAVEGLIQALRSPDVDARYGAAHTLGLIGDGRTIPALTEALADAEPAVRYWAIDSLARLRAEAAVPAIASLLKDQFQNVRQRAALALEQIDTPAARQALEKGQRSGWWPF
jgi:ribosomal protein L40E